jgi:hypothetical protein
VRVTFVTKPAEETVAFPVAPEPPAPVKVSACVPAVQRLLPLPALRVVLFRVVAPSFVLIVRLLVVIFVIVVTLADALALALALAAETTQVDELLQVLSMACARFVASVDVVFERTIHGAVLQVLSHEYEVPPIVIVFPLPGRPLKVAVAVGVAPGAGTEIEYTPTVALAVAPDPPPELMVTDGTDVYPTPFPVTVTDCTPRVAVAVAEVVLPLVVKLTVGTLVYPAPAPFKVSDPTPRAAVADAPLPVPLKVTDGTEV